MDITKLFLNPKIISIVGDINTGKSNLIYHILSELKKKGQFNLYTYGLRNKLKNAQAIYSLEELEQIKNSIIILDEVMSLWDLDNRTAKRQIERTLRLIAHNNNVLLICAVPENLKKFISSKIDVVFFKKSTLADFINGSSVKRILLNYRGDSLGNTILNLNVDRTLLFTGLRYEKLKIPYYKKYDTKKDNPPILSKVIKKSIKRPKPLIPVSKSVVKSVEKTFLKTL